MKINRYLTAILALSATALLSCSKDDHGHTPKPSDYSLTSNWAKLPTSADKPVDIFYVYPTAWQKISDSDPDVCEIDNPIMIQTVNAIMLPEQASVFETVGNIYAPYYRQVAINTLAYAPARKEALLLSKTVPDVIAAFDYFIRHYNQGRPYIIASHSQGSNVLMYLMSGYMKTHPEVYDRMVAAYMIGYDITPGYMAGNPHLRFAESATDTKVIISYNTEAEVPDAPNPVMADGVGLAINPLTWTRTSAYASTAQNLGSMTWTPQGLQAVVPGYADAQVNLTRGTLVCSSVDPDDYFNPANPVMPRGVYHIGDYRFYYYNLRQNAQDRVDTYMAIH